MIIFRSLLHRFFRYGINGNISEKKLWIVFQASLMQLHKLCSQLRGSLFTWFHFPQFICIFIYICQKKFCVTSADKRFWCWKLWILTNLIWQFYNFFLAYSAITMIVFIDYTVSLMDSLTIICLYYYPSKVCNFQM